MVDIPRPRPAEPAGDVWTLVEQAQAGDPNAFAQIYKRYVTSVFRFTYSLVSDGPVAEDLTAETFLRALKRIGSVTWQGRDLGAWLFAIARHLVADYFKSARYRHEVSARDVLDPDGPERGVDAVDHRPEVDPESAFLNQLSRLELLAAVYRLSPDQRECVKQRFLLGRSVPETAMAMGKTEGAVKSTTFRAVHALHRQLVGSTR